MKKKQKAVSLKELQSVFALAASASKAYGGSQKNTGSGGTAEGTGTCEIGGSVAIEINSADSLRSGSTKKKFGL